MIIVAVIAIWIGGNDVDRSFDFTTGDSWSNFAGNAHCKPSLIVVPNSVDELVQVVREAAARGDRVKVTGAGHRFVSAYAMMVCVLLYVRVVLLYE